MSAKHRLYDAVTRARQPPSNISANVAFTSDVSYLELDDDRDESDDDDDEKDDDRERECDDKLKAGFHQTTILRCSTSRRYVSDG